MEVYAARLASFSKTVPAKKKGSSDSKNGKTLKWPHKQPSPSQLAQAGFYYKPSTSNPDNTACYLCHNNMDGWEEQDDPLQEHIRHAPDCGWANAIFIEQAIANGDQALEDPMSEKLLRARSMTFGALWPHEAKRGWTCKIRKMAAAGWHYCPTSESDDFVRCAYCDLSLDGWEPKDDPFDEHQRRSPDCLFFVLSDASSHANGARTKRGRQSRASRVSTQSTISVQSEGTSRMEVDEDDNNIVREVESMKPSRATKSSRKAPKTKKGPHQRMPKDDESQLPSSFIEPEDDDFEIKVEQNPNAKGKGRKRKSEEITDGNHDEIYAPPSSVQQKPDAPAKKRRTTRAQSNASNLYKTQETAPDINNSRHDQAAATADDDDDGLPVKSVKQKKAPGRKRSSSIARKASSISTASKASLRDDARNDADIETALEAALDLALSDDEKDDLSPKVDAPKGRRLTRTKPKSKQSTASVAPTRKSRKTNSTNINELACSEGADAVILREDSPLAHEASELKCKPSATKSKVDKTTTDHKIDVRIESNLQEKDGIEAYSSMPHEIQESNADETERAQQGLLDSNTTIKEGSGHETDSSPVAIKGRPKRGNRKASATQKPVRKVTRTRIDSRNVEHIVRPVTAGSNNTSADALLNTAIASNEKGASYPAIQVKVGGLLSNNGERSEASYSRPTDRTTHSKKTQIPTAQNDVVAANSPMISTNGDRASDQSSDAENQPPSSWTSQSQLPASKANLVRSPGARIPLAAITPTRSPSKGVLSHLQTSLAWTAIDVENILYDTPAGNQNRSLASNGQHAIGSPEKKLSVEEWINFNAERGEERLRNECERIVSKFEGEGMRALQTLEGIACND